MRWLVRLIDDRIEQALILERARRTESDVEKQIAHGRAYIEGRYGTQPVVTSQTIGWYSGGSSC